MYELARTACMNYGFVFEERGKFGRLHWHALVHVKQNLFGDPKMQDLWGHMYERYGRNLIECYNPCAQSSPGGGDSDRMSTGIASYLTKYVAKCSESDNTWWDFEGFMGGSRADTWRIASAIGLPMSADF